MPPKPPGRSRARSALQDWSSRGPPPDGERCTRSFGVREESSLACETERAGASHCGSTAMMGVQGVVAEFDIAAACEADGFGVEEAHANAAISMSIKAW